MESIQEFYQEVPFPNYTGNELIENIEQQAKRFARYLRDQAEPPILEVGCGTGQLSNYLARKHKVVGVDFCKPSLDMAKAFKECNNLANVEFILADLHALNFPIKFNTVICNGALHCTKDPRKGFESIAKLVEEGGHIVIGLYNKIGRLSFYLKKYLVNKGILPKPPTTDIKKVSWYRDQYLIPYETSHTIGEVCGGSMLMGLSLSHVYLTL